MFIFRPVQRTVVANTGFTFSSPGAANTNVIRFTPFNLMTVDRFTGATTRAIRAGSSAAVLNNVSFIFAGEGVYDAATQAVSLKYTDQTVLSVTTSLPDTRRRESTAATLGSKIYILGGAQNAGSTVDTVLGFTDSGTYTAEIAMVASVRGSASGVLTSGGSSKIFVMGGVTGGTGGNNLICSYDGVTAAYVTALPSPISSNYQRNTWVIDNVVYTGGGSGVIKFNGTTSSASTEAISGLSFTANSCLMTIDNVGYTMTGAASSVVSFNGTTATTIAAAAGGPAITNGNMMTTTMSAGSPV